MSVRQPAVAGVFYPEDPQSLRREIRLYLQKATPAELVPKAIIAPHAGTVYSGPVAGTAYSVLKNLRGKIQRVVLLGPAHRVAIEGLAASPADFFSTPLGNVPVDRRALAGLKGVPHVLFAEEPHREEHSIEMQLPFLQETLGEFSLVPLVVGSAKANEVAEVIERFWGGPETLVVISSDLSHYHPYEVARRLDRDSACLIERCDWKGLQDDRACGSFPVRGFLLTAERHGLKGRTLDLRNSGDTAGDKARVVGYGAFHFS